MFTYSYVKNKSFFDITMHKAIVILYLAQCHNIFSTKWHQFILDFRIFYLRVQYFYINNKYDYPYSDELSILLLGTNI